MFESTSLRGTDRREPEGGVTHLCDLIQGVGEEAAELRGLPIHNLNVRPPGKAGLAGRERKMIT